MYIEVSICLCNAGRPIQTGPAEEERVFATVQKGISRLANSYIGRGGGIAEFQFCGFYLGVFYF